MYVAIQYRHGQPDGEGVSKGKVYFVQDKQQRDEGFIIDWSRDELGPPVLRVVPILNLLRQRAQDGVEGRDNRDNYDETSQAFIPRGMQCSKFS